MVPLQQHRDHHSQFAALGVNSTVDYAVTTVSTVLKTQEQTRPEAGYTVRTASVPIADLTYLHLFLNARRMTWD